MITFSMNSDGDFSAEIDGLCVDIEKPLPNIVAAMRALTEFSIDAYREQIFEGLPPVTAEVATAFSKTLADAMDRQVAA